MKNVVKALMLIYCLCWQPITYAVEPMSDKPVQSETTTQPQDMAKPKKKGMSIFWIVFAVAILFVISSATALNRLGGKAPKRDNENPRPRNKSGKDRDRFRL